MNQSCNLVQNVQNEIFAIKNFITMTGKLIEKKKTGLQWK